MHKIYLILSLFLIPFFSSGQKAILLEREGSLKTRKFFVGETLVYKMKQDRKNWLEEVILDIDLETGYILFENRTVSLEEIFAIQIRDGGGFARGLAHVITTFSYSWGFWSLVSLAFGDSLSPFAIGVGLGSFLLGKLLRVTFFKTHRLNKRKRLRMIDLTFYQLAPVRT